MFKSLLKGMGESIAEGRHIKTRYMVGGKIFRTPKEAIQFGKKQKVDFFQLDEVEIERFKRCDIDAHKTVNESLKKLEQMI